jgi:proteic killer suppression protein
MIRSFRREAVRELWTTGKSRKVSGDLQARTLRVLAVLDAAKSLHDLGQTPGFRTHPLVGTKPLRHAMSVSGAWRVTFEWRADGPHNVDLEQYH